MPQPDIHPYRVQPGNNAAIVLVHGFTGKAESTWSTMAPQLLGVEALHGWDIISYGYKTELRVDLLRGLWAANPDLTALAHSYAGALEASPPLDEYQALTLVAHSMGGLVTQRMLVDHPQIRARTRNVVCYGTPSNGLAKASIFRFLTRQVRDMAADSNFLRALRTDWQALDRTFRFFAVAGTEDDFVPSDSSLTPFPEAEQAWIPGNHLTMLDTRAVEFLRAVIVDTDTSPLDRWNSARRAVQEGEFQKVIAELEPHADDLDPTARGDLALALCALGRRDDAIAMLARDENKADSELLGILGGRLKRLWLVERRKSVVDQAMDAYERGLALALAENDPHQAYYHRINLAFINLILKNHDTVRRLAEAALDDTRAAETGDPTRYPHWRLATQAEARLYLGDTEAALELYGRAAAEADPREQDSMFSQAQRILAELDKEDVARRLETVFESAAG